MEKQLEFKFIKDLEIEEYFQNLTEEGCKAIEKIRRESDEIMSEPVINYNPCCDSARYGAPSYT